MGQKSVAGNFEFCFEYPFTVNPENIAGAEFGRRSQPMPRTAANVHNVPCLTTVAAALAAAGGIADWASHDLSVRSLQEYHEGEQLQLGI